MYSYIYRYFIYEKKNIFDILIEIEKLVVE